MKNLFLLLLSFTNQWTQIREMGGEIVKKFMEEFFIYYRRNDICKLGMLQMSLYVVVHIAMWGLREYTWIVICYIGMLF